MGFFSREQPFPKWVSFSSLDKYAEALRLNLGPGDGIAVRLHGRVLPMDLLFPWPEGVRVQDPDMQEFTHDWADVVGYWKRIK